MFNSFKWISIYTNSLPSIILSVEFIQSMEGVLLIAKGFASSALTNSTSCSSSADLPLFLGLSGHDR